MCIRDSETYFVGNYAGGYPYYEDRSIEVALKALDEQIQFVKPSENRADLNRDGKIDGADMAQILSNFGQEGYLMKEDLNNDKIIDGADIGLLMSQWGEIKPNIIAYEDWYFGNTGGNTGDTDNKNGAGVSIKTNGNATAF